MTSYILIEVEDEEQVQAFLEHTKAEKETVRTGGHARLEINDQASSSQVDYEIVGIYRKPTQFCTCVKDGLRKANEKFTKGQKYGWMVCRLCKKAVYMAMHPRNLVAPSSHSLTEMLFFEYGWYDDPSKEIHTPQEKMDAYRDNGYIKPVLFCDYYQVGGKR